MPVVILVAVLLINCRNREDYSRFVASFLSMCATQAENFFPETMWGLCNLTCPPVLSMLELKLLRGLVNSQMNTRPQKTLQMEVVNFTLSYLPSYHPSCIGWAPGVLPLYLIWVFYLYCGLGWGFRILSILSHSIFNS